MAARPRQVGGHSTTAKLGFMCDVGLLLLFRGEKGVGWLGSTEDSRVQPAGLTYLLKVANIGASRPRHGANFDLGGCVWLH